MKLVRYGRPGAERPGAIDAEGKLHDLGRVIEDVTPAALAPASLKKLRGVNLARMPVVKGRPRLGCPIAGMGKMVCIGLNYTDHAAEVGMALPKEPTLFIKAPSAVCGPDDPIVRPRGAVKLDYEVELGVVLGRDARYVSEADALGYVAGYCLVNDVSERAFQMEHAGTTTKGKMIFPCAALIAYVSRFMSLRAGDVISTGTPAGVGHGAKPPRYLQPGDVVEMGITGLGTQRHRIVEAR